MKKNLLIPVLVLSIVMLSCSFGMRRQGSPNSQAEPTQESVQVAQNTPDPTATSVPPTTTPTTEPTEVLPSESEDEEEPYLLTGTFEYTNSIITDYYVEHAVALMDMYGFITRDEEWVMPVESQTLGFLNLDPNTMTGTFRLQLPSRPTAQQTDVNPDGEEEAGLQVFTLAYQPNLTGGPYSEGDDPSWGWPSFLTSHRSDTENNDEVIGGKLVIWAPDEEQEFPSGFGEDGLLFTDDDPVVAVPQGYSVIDLDQEPFAIERSGEVELTLYEPQDIAVKDFSDQSYTEAFNNMFEIVSVEYAFNGIEGKQPDWDALYAELFPRIEEAEENDDPEAFYRAMRDFVLSFQDGHVNLSGGLIENQIFAEETAGGYGFAIRELDDGRVIVTYVVQGSPAAEAGMEVGAELTEFNGQPISEAIGAVKPWSAPHSTDFSLRYQQARYLLRAPLGTEATVTFTNPGGTAQTLELSAINERESFSVTSLFAGFNPYGLPVDYDIFAPGVGYIKISSNYDDLNLIIRIFERALRTFEANGIPSLIIDMRQNSGGANLGLAGFLHDGEIPLGQLEYYSEATGQFEPEGLPGKVIPNQNQYRFERMILLVDQACASACELEAYAFSQVPGMIVLGQYPTAGVEAEVARGQYLLPEGMSMQIPTGRFTLPDGSLFLEGQGVQPTERIEITEEFVLAPGDPVLERAIGLAIE